MRKKVTAIFDIGKTNKKFFLFDKDFHEVYREYVSFEEIQDEDGYPSENLPALKIWLIELFNRILKEDEFEVKAINFSTYGASLVHIDKNGKLLTPLYNYTKPMDKQIIDDFFDKYGPEDQFSTQTGSSNSGMLNSGMQLYWLKYKKPEVFKKIRYSLHLPQYLSYIFTRIPLSEYTSIGCHTALWDYQKKDYHYWVYKEKIDKKLAPLVSTETSVNMNYKGKKIKIGVGIHDSSSALLPYIRGSKNPFILVSTGTWSVSLNPFTQNDITRKEISDGCINYMRINGDPVKSSRIFLGKQYQLQVEQLAIHFDLDKNHHKTVRFDQKIYSAIKRNFKPFFLSENWQTSLSLTNLNYDELGYSSFEWTYHHLMIELVQEQVKKIEVAKGDSNLDEIFIDGGFSDNNIFINLLSYYLPNMKLTTTDSSLGTALGAAIVISDVQFDSKFLKKNYALKKHKPFIIR